MVAEGDLCRGTLDTAGTNTGPWGGVAPTARSCRFSGVNIVRFEDGKVAGIWNHRDDLGLQEQLDAPIYAGAQANA